MKYLKNFKTFEGKQRGNLYHIFDMEKLDFILKTNSLKSYKFGYISTTRNKNMNRYLGDSPTSIFKLELDGDKISNNYKISPISYKTANNQYLEEFEEVIKTHDIKNIKSYVKKFIIIKSRVENLKEFAWFDSDGGFLNNERISLPELFKKYIPIIRNMFGDIWIQDNNNIIKDDEWIDSIINYKLKIINHAYALYWRGTKKEYIEKLDDYLIVDDIISFDNNKISELIIGKEYDDLKLHKNKNFKLPEPRENYDLYLFDFIYNDEDILTESDDIVNVKSGYLKNVKFLLKKTNI